MVHSVDVDQLVGRAARAVRGGRPLEGRGMTPTQRAIVGLFVSIRCVRFRTNSGSAAGEQTPPSFCIVNSRKLRDTLPPRANHQKSKTL